MKKRKKVDNMSGIKLNLKNTGISEKSIMEYKEQVENIHKELNLSLIHI